MKSMHSRYTSCLLGITLLGFAGLTLSCSKPALAAAESGAFAAFVTSTVEVRDGGPLVMTTSTAEFQVLPSGYLQATLLKDGKRLTLDEPGVGSTGGSDSVVHEGRELDFVPDFAQAKVLENIGKLGRGKRVEIPARPLAPAGVNVERMLVVEAYDDFPNIALVSSAYKNVGAADFEIDQVWMQQHRLNSHEVKAHPYDMWSFQGSSYDWGKDDVQKLTRTSSQPNVMGEMVKGGYGGGIPVVAFWTASVGRGDRSRRDAALDAVDSGEGGGRRAGECERRDSGACRAETRRNFFDATQLCVGVQRRFLRTAAHVVERAAARRMGYSEALKRSLQRELVRMGIRVQRDAEADAGHDPEAEGAGHQVGDAG